MSACPHCGKESATPANCFPYNNEDEDEKLCWLEYHGYCEALPPKPMKTAPQIIQQLEADRNYYREKSDCQQRTINDLNKHIHLIREQLHKCLEAIAQNHQAMQKLHQKGPDQ